MFINDLTHQELEKNITQIGMPKYRADQIFRWIHKSLESDYVKMTNLSIKDINCLKDSFQYDMISIYKKYASKVDETKKYLFELGDRNIIESVFLRYDFGDSVCISSQAGCNMGCVFCASTIGGKARNLRASEMLEQVYMIQKDTKTRIDSIVVMGSGEPLDNYNNLKKFMNIITDENGLNISKRKITVSTCGIIDKIYTAATDNLGFNLAISLHAAIQEKRNKLIPASKKYLLKDLIEACDHYTLKSGRRVTYEYIMIDGFNDTDEDIKSLTALLKNSNCHVNLIPLNPISEFNGKAPSDIQIRSFQRNLMKNKINTTVRRELGRDINAACGQLRNNHIK
ncbi:MAG TPA: 23S rRNA (adenine(2503)-C(2))-methyltransferase RlmN [Clostridiales bacterium]|nr:23S rRNA (adenine(2503)-C(2))-methyltransferase RlmN [Clostridiales bacterium]